MGFHALTSAIDYPMFVVTVANDGARAGCLVGFTTQCSIDPPRYAVCISDTNRTARVAAGADVLAVHLLGKGQKDLAELFGGTTGDEVDKFERCRWTPAGDGVGTPLLVDCPNRFLGRVVTKVPAGDHTIYLLDVDHAESADGRIEQLTFQQVRAMDPGHPA